MTMDEMGKDYHDRGFNCCQSVLCTLRQYTGLSEETSAALASGFGGGMRCGSVCGAVTGGLMAIGCACFSGKDPAEEKEPATELTLELEAEFQQQMGTLLCEDILRDHEHDKCDDCIAAMARAAEKIIRREKKLEQSSL